MIEEIKGEGPPSNQAAEENKDVATGSAVNYMQMQDNSSLQEEIAQPDE